MILAVDVGGTHADGVLLRQAAGGENEMIKLAGSVKIAVEDFGLENAVLQVIERLLHRADSAAAGGEKPLERAVISTTLTTNALAQNRADPVGLILIPGPGLDIRYSRFGDENFILSGYVDHRGRIVREPSREEVISAGRELAGSGLENVAVVGKFSVRNPELELKVKKWLQESESDFRRVVTGHELSASLNFRRRAATACCHAAVSRLHEEFREDIRAVLSEHLQSDELYFLKSDGGTMRGKKGEAGAVRSVKSGPAASIMGAMVLTELKDSGFIIDIGGTTTDISFFLNGDPLLEPRGMKIEWWDTLIRGLFSRSVPAGGDSRLQTGEEAGLIEVGPGRRGQPAALGGPAPTPTDALLLLEELEEPEEAEGSSISRDYDLSRAESALEDLGNVTGLTARELARKSLEELTEIIADACRNIRSELQGRPVHTIAELLEDVSPDPQVIIGMGGPAASIIPRVAERLDLDFEILPRARVANAIGAGCARPTLRTTVRVDTEREQLTVPQLGISRSFRRGESFDRERAEELALELTEERYDGKDAGVEIVSSEVFPTVSGFRTTGEIMEITAQIKPGLLYKFSPGEVDFHAQD